MISRFSVHNHRELYFDAWYHGSPYIITERIGRNWENLGELGEWFHTPGRKGEIMSVISLVIITHENGDYKASDYIWERERERENERIESETALAHGGIS